MRATEQGRVQKQQILREEWLSISLYNEFVTFNATLLNRSYIRVNVEGLFSVHHYCNSIKIVEIPIPLFLCFVFKSCRNLAKTFFFRNEVDILEILRRSIR